jgi:Flp pilus assembly protein TadD
MSQHSTFSLLRVIALAGVAALVLSACASARTSARAPDFSGLSPTETQSAVAELSARYQANPRDRNTAVTYAAALRVAGQNEQATAVLAQATLIYPNDAEVTIAYAKSLTASGKFSQALKIIDKAITPENPTWNSLSVKGAILDQMGQNRSARALYSQALLIAPMEASLHANLGLSFALSSDLSSAETHLAKAVALPGANAQIRQNLALVLGLQGRFEEARALYAADLSPERVEANMAYVKGLLTQKNRWDLLKDAG